MKTFIVDAFTDVPFKGNPAGVCIVSEKLDDERMLSIAQELGFSETAFIAPLDSHDTFSIRYFSPKMEIPLCGHATLASAKVVMETHQTNVVNFLTAAGVHLPVARSDGQITMRFPVYETHPADAPAELLDALGLRNVENAVYNRETCILLLEISDSTELAGLTPDFDALRRSHDSINGVLVTAASNSDKFDFHSRYFWPWSGTNEDPVTGGTHTFLAKYWSGKLGKNKMKSFQSSSRTGFMDVELNGHDLLIKGHAVIVFEGQMTRFD